MRDENCLFESEAAGRGGLFRGGGAHVLDRGGAEGSGCGGHGAAAAYLLRAEGLQGGGAVF